MFRLGLLFAFLAASWRADAFVFYQVAGNVLRWNPSNPGLHTNVFNPVTKAIRYYVASDVFSTTNRQNEINAIRAAFDQWQAVPGANVKFEFAGFVSPDGLDMRYDNMNVIFWAKKSPLVAGGTHNLTGERAWTYVTYALDGSILDADIALNGVHYQWYTDFERPTLPNPFVETSLLHEIGHLLGLDHSPAGGATVMNGALGVSTELGLSADELAAGRFLYPAANTSWSTIRGKIRMNGNPVFGAIVTVEDAAGNVAGVTVTDANGDYLAPSLAAGTYKVRVSPFDPPGPSTFLKGEDIAPDYALAQTSFLPTTNTVVLVAANQTKTQDITVASGEPATRILGLSKPTPDEGAVTFDRAAVSIQQGQSNYFTGVVSRSLKPGSVLSITGDGVSVGTTRFLSNRFGVGLHAMIAPISVSSNATPGLRSFVITHSTGLAYANGYLEVAPAVTDFNLDGLSDRFQRLYWSPWTTNSAAPGFDADGDGFSNGYEYRTGTNPTNKSSYLLRLNAPSLGRFTAALSFPADSGKRYQLLGADRIPLAWEPVGAAVTATNELMTVSDPTRGAAKFYRLQLVP